MNQHKTYYLLNIFKKWTMNKRKNEGYSWKGRVWQKDSLESFSLVLNLMVKFCYPTDLDKVYF